MIETTSLNRNNKFSIVNFLEKPLIQIVLNLKPNLGTTLPSILDLVPTNKISASGTIALIFSATATAGNKCPPVPPPANKNLNRFFCMLEIHLRHLCSIFGIHNCNVHKNTNSTARYNNRSSAITNKR